MINNIILFEGIPKFFRRLLIIILLLGRISPVYAARSDVKIEQESSISYLKNVEEKLDSALEKIENKISNPEIEEQVADVRTEIKALIKEQSQEIKDVSTQEEVAEIVDETKKRIVLKTYDSLTDHDSLEDLIDVSGGKNEQQKAIDATLNVINNGERKTLIVKTRRSFTEAIDFLQNLDESVTATHLFDEDNWTFLDVQFSVTGLIAQEILDTTDEGIIPDRLIDFIVVKPGVFTLDQISIAGESVEKLRGAQLWNTPLYQEGLQQLPAVSVGVIDTGVDYTHPDLASAISTTIPGYDFVNDDADPLDDHQHGTHVAGTIAGQLNGAGVFGVNTNIEIVPMKICTSLGYCPTYAILNAIAYASQQGIDVINMSISGQETVINNPVCQALDSAAKQGVVAVVAAGNHNNNTGLTVPGACPKTITVGAIEEDLSRASFSNRGPLVDISAPGNNIYSTKLGGGYMSLNGTSMASPHVTGVVGAIKAIHPTWGYDEVKDLLLNEPLSVTYESGKYIGPLVNFESVMDSLGIAQSNVVCDSGNPCPTIAQIVCDQGFHDEGGACVSDRQSCTIANGQGEQERSHGIWLPCTTVTCDTGFVLQQGFCEEQLPVILEENVPTEGLILHYDFEEDGGLVTDSSASGNNGIVDGNVTFRGGVAQFDQRGERIKPTIPIDLSEIDYTIAMDIKLPLQWTDGFKNLARQERGDHQIIIHKDGRIGTFQKSQGKVRLIPFNLFDLSDGRHHLVAVGEGNTTKFYINGGYVGTSAYKSVQTIESLGGTYASTKTQSFGMLDDIRIYNRALTAEEIADRIPGTTREDTTQINPGTKSYSLETGQDFIMKIFGGTTPYTFSREDETLFALGKLGGHFGSVAIAGDDGSGDTVFAPIGGDDFSEAEYNEMNTGDELMDDNIFEEMIDEESLEESEYGGEDEFTTSIASAPRYITSTQIKIKGLKPGVTDLTITDSLGATIDIPITVTHRVITKHLGQRMWLGRCNSWFQTNGYVNLDRSVFGDPQYLSCGKYLVTPLQLGSFPLTFKFHNKHEKVTQHLEYIVKVVEPPIALSISQGEVVQGEKITLGITGGTPPYTVRDPRKNNSDFISPTDPITNAQGTTVDLVGVRAGWTNILIKDARGYTVNLPVQVLPQRLHLYPNNSLLQPGNLGGNIHVESIKNFVGDLFETITYDSTSGNWELVPFAGKEGVGVIELKVRNSDLSPSRPLDTMRYPVFIGDDGGWESYLVQQNISSLKKRGGLNISRHNGMRTIDIGTSKQLVFNGGTEPYTITTSSNGVAVTESYVDEQISISSTYTRHSIDVTGMVPGEHTVTITSADNKITSVNITVPGPIPLTMSSDEVVLDVGDAVSVTIEDGTPTYSIVRGDSTMIGLKTYENEGVTLSTHEAKQSIFEFIGLEEEMMYDDSGIPSYQWGVDDPVSTSELIDIGIHSQGSDIANVVGNTFTILGLKPGTTTITVTDETGREGVINVTVNETVIHMLPGVSYTMGGVNHGYWYGVMGLSQKTVDDYSYFDLIRRTDGHFQMRPSYNKVGTVGVRIPVYYEYKPQGTAYRPSIRYGTLNVTAYIGTIEQYALFQSGNPDLGAGTITVDKEEIFLQTGQEATIAVEGGTPNYSITKDNESVALGLVEWAYEGSDFAVANDGRMFSLASDESIDSFPADVFFDKNDGLSLEIGESIVDSQGNNLFIFDEEKKIFYENNNPTDGSAAISNSVEGDILVKGLIPGETIVTITDSLGYHRDITVTVLPVEETILPSALPGRIYHDRVDENDIRYLTSSVRPFGFDPGDYSSAQGTPWTVFGGIFEDTNIVNGYTLGGSMYYYGVSNGTAKVRAYIYNHHERKHQKILKAIITVEDFTYQQRQDLLEAQEAQRAANQGNPSSIDGGGAIDTVMTDNSQGGENLKITVTSIETISLNPGEYTVIINDPEKVIPFIDNSTSIQSNSCIVTIKNTQGEVIGRQITCNIIAGITEPGQYILHIDGPNHSWEEILHVIDYTIEVPVAGASPIGFPDSGGFIYETDDKSIVEWKTVGGKNYLVGKMSGTVFVTITIPSQNISVKLQVKVGDGIEEKVIEIVEGNTYELLLSNNSDYEIIFSEEMILSVQPFFYEGEVGVASRITSPLIISADSLQSVLIHPLPVGEYIIQLKSMYSETKLRIKVVAIDTLDRFYEVGENEFICDASYNNVEELITNTFKRSGVFIDDSSGTQSIYNFYRRFSNQGEWNLKAYLNNQGMLQDSHIVQFGNEETSASNIGNMLYGYLAEVAGMYDFAILVALEFEKNDYVDYYGEVLGNKRAFDDEQTDKVRYALGKELANSGSDDNYELLKQSIEAGIALGNDEEQPFLEREEQNLFDICTETIGTHVACYSYACGQLIEDYYILSDGGERIDNINCF